MPMASRTLDVAASVLVQCICLLIHHFLKTVFGLQVLTPPTSRLKP